MATTDEKADTLVWEAVLAYDVRAHGVLSCCDTCRDMVHTIWHADGAMRCQKCMGKLLVQTIPGMGQDSLEALLEYADVIQLRRKPDGTEKLDITHFTDETRRVLSRYDG